MRYNDCHLSIRFDDNEIVVALQDRQHFNIRQQHILPTEQVGNTDSVANTIQQLQPFSSVQTVSCSFNLPDNTLIPCSVYHNEYRNQYLSFNFDTEAHQPVTADEISFLDAQNIYLQPKSVEVISKLFPQCRFFHETTVEIELAMRLSRVSNPNGAYLYFSDRFFRLLIIRNDKLELANTFHFGSEMDVAYYVLYVFDQLGIRKSEIAVSASGKIGEGHAVLNLLREYIGKVTMLQFSPLVDLKPSKENQHDISRFFTLYHQILLCES